mgnify:CR=1 FL=1
MATNAHLKKEARIAAMEFLLKTLMADILTQVSPVHQKEQMGRLVEAVKEGTTVAKNEFADPDNNQEFLAYTVEAMTELTAEISDLANAMRAARNSQ